MTQVELQNRVQARLNVFQIMEVRSIPGLDLNQRPSV